MSVHVNRAMLNAIERDKADVEWLRQHLQWKFGLVPGMKPFAENLMQLIRERFALDIMPADKGTPLIQREVSDG